MPTYTAYVTYTIEDSIEIEADSYDDAMNKAEDMVSSDPALLPYSTSGNFTLAWDDVNVYEVIEEEA